MAKKKLLYIDPVGTDLELEQTFLSYLCKYAAEDTEVTVKSLGKAPMDLEYRYYLALIGQDLLRMVKQAEKDGYDAVILGCFMDPYLDTAREICTKMVVVGPAEASLKLATTLGRTFSVMVANYKSVPPMRDNIYRLGFKDQLTSFRSLDLAIEELLEDDQRTEQLMHSAIRAAIVEDHAEVIVMGCTLQLGHFESLQKTYGLPVIDICVAALKYAEYLVAVRDVCQWNSSKLGDYSTPPSVRLRGWGLEKKYGVEGLFED